MKCPQCGEPHTLSQCPRWRVPTGAVAPWVLAVMVWSAMWESLWT